MSQNRVLSLPSKTTQAGLGSGKRNRSFQCRMRKCLVGTVGVGKTTAGEENQGEGLTSLWSSGIPRAAQGSIPLLAEPFADVPGAFHPQRARIRPLRGLQGSPGQHKGASPYWLSLLQTCQGHFIPRGQGSDLSLLHSHCHSHIFLFVTFTWPPNRNCCKALSTCGGSSSGDV